MADRFACQLFRFGFILFVHAQMTEELKPVVGHFSAALNLPQNTLYSISSESQSVEGGMYGCTDGWLLHNPSGENLDSLGSWQQDRTVIRDYPEHRTANATNKG